MGRHPRSPRRHGLGPAPRGTLAQPRRGAGRAPLRGRPRAVARSVGAAQPRPRRRAAVLDPAPPPRAAAQLSLPNLISLGRLLAVPLIVWLILAGELGWAFAVFIAAGIS